ncbi:DNA-formamidopyrimidine glycosylase family protein [Microbacterium sp. GXF7504]
MPESPEVQALAEYLADRMIGHRIRSLRVLDHRVAKTRPVADLAGERVNGVIRFGKHLEIDAGADHLVCSFGRHGWALWHDADAPDPGPDAVARLDLETGSTLDIVDTGSFRSVGLWTVAEASDVPGIRKLGTDPADPSFTRADVDRAFRGRRKMLKAILQEQESIAGIGNAYSDEILFAAHLAPTRHASTLSPEEVDRLYTAITTVIRGAVADRRGLAPADMKAAKTAAMRVHGRAGEPCPDGHGTIVDFTFGGTTAQYCPDCQRESP